MVDYKKIQEARKEGYSDDEIMNYLNTSYPDFSSKFETAKNEGYSSSQILDYLGKKPKRTKLEQAGRVGAQFALGAAENALLPYELGVAPLASKEAQQVPYRENLFQDIERLQEQKQMGVWDEQDEQLLNHLIDQAKDTEKSEKYIQTADISVRGLAEKATGMDLHPEGVLEKGVHWMGFLKNPANIKNLIKMGTSPKEIIKAIMPGKTVMRGLAAGTALQIAEGGNFGPIGTMAAAVVGDLMGGGVAGLGKAIAHPKQTLAKGAALLSNTKNAIKSDLKEAAEQSGYTKDIGTLTNNNMVKMVQSRLAASGLTGAPLEQLRKQMTKEVVDAYKSIAEELGEARFQSLHEAGEITKEAIEGIKDTELSQIRDLYNETRAAGEGKTVVSEIPRLAASVEKLEKTLSAGKIKSPQQKEVLSQIESLKAEMFDEAGNLRPVSVEALLNNKIALNDIINYEVQGGAKQLLKGIVKDIDDALESYGRSYNKNFYKNYIKANAKFQKHAKEFRNRDISKLLITENPESLMSRMNTISGMRRLETILNKTPEGKEIFNNLKRMKLDKMLGEQMENSVTEQLKSGKFLSALDNKNNIALLKEMLPKEAFSRLMKLKAHVGELAESAQKFLNASQSATAGTDLAIMGSILMGTVGGITGNPWAIMGAAKTAGVVLGARQLSKLISDPKFLKMVEEAITASKKNNLSLMQKVSKNMIDHIKETVPAIIHEIPQESA